MMSAPETALTSIFDKTLVKIDSYLIPPEHGQPRDIRNKQDTVARWINMLGEKSTKAQGLDRQLTIVEKFIKSVDEELYAYIDRAADNGRGEMIGYLRTGKKSLYFHKDSGEIIQKYPECVLDFYVTEENQRRGIGKILYDFMLQDKNLSPYMLAIDKPSKKMSGFLHKYYGLGDMRLYSNNYAVSPQFFSGTEVSRVQPEAHAPVGRYTARRPRTQMELIIHGDRL